MEFDIHTLYSVVQGDSESKQSLAELLAPYEKTILYFYPKDDTPGCSLEAKDFSCLANIFLEKAYGIIGVSRDSSESHKKFIEKFALNFPLISDESLNLHKIFGAYGEKNNYGKIIQGVIRSTFILDKSGHIVSSYRNVKATGHAEKILKSIS